MENSHASTALSYADGLAKAFAAARRAPTARVVAVVGDGALTGGMAWEALNNLGARRRPAGGRRAQRQRPLLRADRRRPGRAPGRAARRPRRRRCSPRWAWATSARSTGTTSPRSRRRCARPATARTPTVVHCVTTKGRGYRAGRGARAGPDARRSAPAGRRRGAGTGGRCASLDRRVRRGDRPTGGGDPRGRASPPRCCEPDRAAAVRRPRTRTGCSTSASPSSTRSPRPPGLAMGGLHPVVCVYATFLNRAFDQVLMDVALHRLPVTFVLDRAGVTGTDGASHHGMWDLALLGVGARHAGGRAPRRRTTRELLAEAVADEDGPTAVRFPKGRVGPSLPALGRLGPADAAHAPGAPADGAAARGRRDGRAPPSAAAEASWRAAGVRPRPSTRAGCCRSTPRWSRPRPGTGWWSPSRTAAWPAASATPSAGPCARPARAPTCSPWGCRSGSSPHGEREATCSPPRGLDVAGCAPRPGGTSCHRPRSAPSPTFEGWSGPSGEPAGQGTVGAGSAADSQAGNASHRGTTVRGVPRSSARTTAAATRAGGTGRGTRRS